MTNEEIKKLTWQVQAEHNICDAVNDWSYHRFACLMKDNSVEIFSGMCEKTDNGEVRKDISSIENRLSYDLDDIVMWIEIPSI